MGAHATALNGDVLHHVLMSMVVAGPNGSLAQPAHKNWAQSDAVVEPSWGRQLQQQAVWPQTQQGHNSGTQEVQSQQVRPKQPS